jgi:hypothetical protein
MDRDKKQQQDDEFDRGLEEIFSKSKVFVVAVVVMMGLLVTTICWAIVMLVLYLTDSLN